MTNVLVYPKAKVPKLTFGVDGFPLTEKMWAEQAIGRLFRSPIEGVQVLQQRPWSKVFKWLLLDGTTIIHKIPQGGFLSEAAALGVVLPVSKCVPHILAVNERSMAFLSNYCAGEKLRDYVRRTHDYLQLVEPIRLLAKLQVSLGQTEISANIERMSIEGLMRAANGVLERAGRSTGKMDAIESALERLFSVFGLSLEHGDFQDNNILLTEANGSYTILDWGDAVVSCPIFSLATYIHSIQLAHNGVSPEIRDSIVKAYGDSWGIKVPQMAQALEDCHLVFPLIGLFKTLRLDELGSELEDYRNSLLRYWLDVLISEGT